MAGPPRRSRRRPTPCASASDLCGSTVIINGLSVAVLFALSLTGAWLDLSDRRLPNLLCLVTAVAGCTATVLAGGTDALLSALLHMGLALAVGMLLFGLKMVGGGDAKFYTAVASWFPLAEAARLLLLVSGSGVVLLIIWIVVRRIAGKPLSPKAGSKFDGLPYGVAIGSGATIAVLMRLPLL